VKKVLIITYYWPPSGGVGVQRWMNYALNLRELGIEPIILTPENPQFSVKDDQLLDRVKNIITYKTPIWEPFQIFHQLTGNTNKGNVKQGLVMEKKEKTIIDQLTVWIRGNIFLPDPRVFWFKNAVKKAQEIIKKEGIEHVITTGPPHSVHLIGRKLKRLSSSIFWLADFRDPWSKWDILDKLQTGTIAKEVHRRLEASVLNESDQAITVSNRLAKSFGNVDVLNNGLTITNNEEENPDPSKFTVGYFGMLNELRNPQRLWLLLDQLCRENSIFASRFRLKIGGIVADSIQSEIEQLEYVGKRVEFIGYLSHHQVQVEYKKCNLLLLLLNKSDNSKWILPVKFFEYLAAKRQILALGPRESDLGDLMKGKEIGEILDYAEVEFIRSFIINLFENPSNPNPDDVKELIEAFSHQKLTMKLIQLLKINEK